MKYVRRDSSHHVEYETEGDSQEWGKIVATSWGICFSEDTEISSVEHLAALHQALDAAWKDVEMLLEVEARQGGHL